MWSLSSSILVCPLLVLLCSAAVPGTSVGLLRRQSGGKEACCKGPEAAPAELLGTTYVFAGFGTAFEARQKCRGYDGLPMPKTPGEQTALQAAVDAALTSGNLSRHWPSNTIWLGGQWNITDTAWKWDDGHAIAGGDPNSKHELPHIGASSESLQHAESWLCMVLTGTWEDSRPDHKFGILCRQQAKFDCSLSGSAPDSWSTEHRGWCCKRVGVACPFDCYAGRANWRSGWSARKKEWCCQNRNLGCSDTANSSHVAATHANTTADGKTATVTLPARELILPDAPSTSMLNTSAVEKATTTLPPSSATTPTPTTAVKTSTESSSSSWLSMSTGTGTLPQTSSAVSTSKAAALTTTASMANTDKGGVSDECLEEAVTWEPMHMPNVLQPIDEPDAYACQKRCAGTPGCAHFSFWTWGKHCYLQDSFAIRQTGRLGFVSGPFQCWDSLDHDAFTKVGDKTYLHKAFKCVELGTIYSPMIQLPQYFTEAETGIEAAKACKQLCASTEGCAHWTMHFPQRMCKLSGPGAQRTRNAINSVSGPPACGKGPASTAVGDAGASDRSSALMIAAERLRRVPRGSPAAASLPWSALLAAGAACGAAALVWLRLGHGATVVGAVAARAGGCLARRRAALGYTPAENPGDLACLSPAPAE